jgi:U32 family peptidase
MKSIKEIEIMSPAGSYESFMAAIQGRAGSIYFGIGNLNMRSKSTYNFSLNDLERLTSIARSNGVKTYLTVNTVMYDEDLPEMYAVLDAAKQNQISAIIASDQSAILYARKIGMEVHISTQLNVSNYMTVEYYAQFADVIVLARELNLNQVGEICRKIEQNNLLGPSGKKVRIEIFVHGALCMAISGKCYLSLHEQNYSANRGKCLQTCRKAYIVTEKESGYELEVDNEYIMSPKDLKTIHFLNKILDAGVSVLKIEGRARSPEYIKTVTTCYKEAVESYFNNSFDDAKIDSWNKKLSAVFNRGFWDGYYLGQKLGEWNNKYGSRTTKQKIYIGKCTNYFKNLNVAEILIETGELNTDDEIIIIGETTGVIEMNVNELRVNLAPSEKAVKGEKVSIPMQSLIRRNDKLYKLISLENKEALQ